MAPGVSRVQTSDTHDSADAGQAAVESLSHLWRTRMPRRSSAAVDLMCALRHPTFAEMGSDTCGHWLARAFVALAALLAAPLPLARSVHAQESTSGVDSAAVAARTVTLVGIVRDTSGRPLSGAEVRAGAQQFTLSEVDGRFLLTGVAPDTIQLLIRRIGYLPANVVLEAQAGLRVELAVKLVPAAVQLGTIIVEGRRMDTRLLQSGFYNRQKLGRGTFFDPEKLERYGATLSGLMYEVPSVRVAYGRAGSGVAYGPSGFGGHCPLNVFLDGVLIRWAGEIGLDQLVNRQDVLAIEVYSRATQVPSALAGYTGGVGGGSGGLPSPGSVSLRGADAVDCGAVVIWTKPIGV